MTQSDMIVLVVARNGFYLLFHLLYHILYNFIFIALWVFYHKHIKTTSNIHFTINQ